MICPCSTIDKKFVPPEGSRKPRVYIAGMVPGEEEAKEGRPFVGPSGKVLRSALADAGIDIESEVRIFNAVACRTVRYGTNTNRDPSPEEIENCKEYLFTDIEKTQPDIILVLGRTAASAFFDSSESKFPAVSDMIKEEFVHQGIRLKVGYHPSYIQRNGGIGSTFYNNYVIWLKKFSIDKKYKYELKSLTVMNSDEFLEWTPPSDHLGFDIEATSLDTTGKDFLICGLGFSDVDGNGFYIYLNDEDEFVKISDKMRNIILTCTLYVFNFSYEGVALGTKLQIHPYQWKMIDTRQSALVQARKGTLKSIAQTMGFPDWETDNTWINACIKDLYKLVFNKAGKKEKIYLTSLKESWESFTELLKLKSQVVKKDKKGEIPIDEDPESQKEKNKKLLSLYEKTRDLEEKYSDPGSIVDIEKLRSVFIAEADKKISRYFFDLIPVNIISKYCAFDAFAAIKIHHIIWEELDEIEKKAFGYFNEHSELGASIVCNGVGWSVEKAIYLDDYYQKTMLEAIKSLLNNVLFIKELGLTTHDLTEINSSTDIATCKKWFNPNSNHKNTRELFSRIVSQTFGKRIYALYSLYNKISFYPTDRFVNLRRKFVHLLREDKDPEVMKRIREEKRNFISGDEQGILDVLHLYGFKKGVFQGSEFEGMLYFFELEQLDEKTIVPLFNAFNIFGGIDVDDKSTWVPEFEALYYFRLFKKVLKSYSTYLWGTTGMGEDVKLIKSEDSDLISPPTITPDWKKCIRESMNGYKPVATWGYNVNGADTNRWKGRYHVWPPECELQDLKISRYNTGLLAHVDYSQMEIRTIASLAGETDLLEAFEKGKDIHRFMASQIFNKSEDEVDDTERRYSKMLTFSILYGKTEYGVAMDFLGGDRNRAKILIDGFYNGFSKIKKYIDGQHEVVINGGEYVRSIFGEKIFLRLVGIEVKEEKRIAQLKKYAVNYPVQSSASNIAGIGINRVNREAFQRGLKLKTYGFIHDAGDFDFDAKCLFDFLDIINRRMETDILSEFGIPVKVGIEIGVTGNSLLEFDIKERSPEKLVVDVEGPLQALKDVKGRFEDANIQYNLDVKSIKEEFVSRQQMFILKKSFSDKFGQNIKTVKAEFEIFNPNF